MDSYEKDLRIRAMEYAETHGNGSVAVQAIENGGIFATVLDAEHREEVWGWGLTSADALADLLAKLGERASA